MEKSKKKSPYQQIQDIEPQKGDLEDEFPFQGSMSVFQGVTPKDSMNGLCIPTNSSQNNQTFMYTVYLEPK